jgi:hypothetical protein
MTEHWGIVAHWALDDSIFVIQNSTAAANCAAAVELS